MKTAYHFALLVFSILFISSCTERFETENGGRKISCIVDLQSTRASVPASGTPGSFISQRIISSASGPDIIETVYENELPLCSFDTRAAQLTTDGASGSTSIATDGFVMTAYAENEWHDNEIASGLGSISNPYPLGLYFGPVDVTYNDGWNISGSPCWLNDVPISFWCWNKDAEACISSPSYTAGQEPLGDLTFGISLPAPATAAPYNDAVNLKDMVFAFNNENRRFNDEGDIVSGESSGSRTDDKIDIHFYHALSAVQFFTGNVPSGYRISRVSLKNVASSADASVSADSPLRFDYRNYDNLVTYSQDYDVDDTSIAPRSGTGPLNNPGDSKTFFVIPQTLGADAALEVTIVSTSNPSDVKVSSYSLEDIEWADGKFYIYKLNVAGEVSVTIEEQASLTTKSNVRFNNTNNVSEYFRAAIVANWYDDSGNIVAPWNPSTEGTFVGLTGTGWTRESDGFYYCTDPVQAGQSSPYLFNSFTLPAISPVTGAHLEMTILVQAVAYKKGLSCANAFHI